jgi:hypothetical protein
MSNEIFAAVEQPTTDAAARLYLDQIMALVGVDGLVEALQTPGLLAEIDQHAAAVRESLRSAGKAIGPVGLSSYARSVLAVHERHGRPLPSPETVNWVRPDWTVLRLVAICSLADAADCF